MKGPSLPLLFLSLRVPPSLCIHHSSLKAPDEWWTRSWKYPGSSAPISLLFKVCHCVGCCSVLQCVCAYVIYTSKSLKYCPKYINTSVSLQYTKNMLVFLCLLFIYKNIHRAVKVLLPVSCHLSITTTFSRKPIVDNPSVGQQSVWYLG